MMEFIRERDTIRQRQKEGAKYDNYNLVNTG